jgi:hypothetical protein
MRRLVAKFLLRLQAGRLPGTPSIDLSFLIPPLENDEFGRVLHEVVSPIAERYVVNCVV